MLADRIKAGEIKKCAPDKEEAKSYLGSAIRRLKFIEKAKLTPEDAPYIFAEYYEAIRTLCERKSSRSWMTSKLKYNVLALAAGCHSAYRVCD